MKIKKQRRSEKLKREEHADLLTWIKSCPSKEEAANEIGITRASLHTISATGSAKPSTCKLIRRVLKKAKVA